MATFERYDVGLTLFPFTERRGGKTRPCLILTDEAFHRAHGHVIAAMITTASVTKWPSDIPISQLSAAGLRTSSVVRMKLFTLEVGRLIGRIGALAPPDREAVAAARKWVLG